ncbi:ATP-binding cassette, subfamily B [Sharpea azabuensis]|uniref:ABC transporter ATP-binding protein n=1 Tax=Sharpea azabuensis TaxID=322505 RepID=UPI0008EAA9B9|nr:ABC transporter ATP-binding protein [Sharpea azabuensis]SFE26006.1 ATP-binding cassette, subfamily B [Sharpea azabuensis]SFL11236.1 ATP-binding cassette, subfamily B [Sharpea azabuensis]
MRKYQFFGLRKIIPYIKPYRKEMIIMVILGVVSSLFDSIYPLFNRYVLNHYLALKTLDTIVYFVALYVFVLVLQVIANYISSYMISKVELYVGRDLKNASFNHLQTLSFSYFNTNNVGYIHARVMSDTDRIGTLVSWRLMDLVWNLSYLIIVFVIMARIHLKLTLILMLLIPIAVLLIMYFQKHLVVLNRKIREINSLITANFNEGISGAKSIKTLVVEDTVQHDFEEDSREMQKVSIHATHYSALFVSTISIMSSLALAVVLAQGGRLSQENLMAIGTLSVFMSYAIGMIDPIQAIVEVFSAMIQAQANIERFSTLMETKSDVADRLDVIERYGDTFHPKKENWEDLHGDIEFKDVSFHYPDGEEMVLEHFNLKVPQGQNVAIVGETGAGKSTLVNLVCRFFEPTSGQVLIDGKDARDRSTLWLHSHIGYVLQTPHLFSGSVRDNMRYGAPEATDEEIWQALELVKASEIVKKMGNGLDSDVGEGGDLLSTGEKQLLSFARAILANPAILVLDEATSSIDTMTEKAIQDAIQTVIKGRTSFMIAHRLSTIVDADVILVVRDGKIVESGKHDELMKKHGYYYELYSRQFEEIQTEKAL